MYYIKLDDKLLSGSGEYYREGYELFEPLLDSIVNDIGHFSFTVFPSHPMYNDITKPKKLLSVWRKGEKEPLFVGRLSSYETGFTDQKAVEFEGELSFLLDSVRTDFSSSVGYSAEYWLDELLRFHNSHAGNYGDIYTNTIGRKFSKGTVSDSISSRIVYISDGQFSGTHTTWEIICELLLTPIGGVVKLRHEGDETFIDWFSETELSTSSQKIKFGENLLDLRREQHRDTIYTAIRPIGDIDSDTSQPLSIKLYDASAHITNEDIVQVIDDGVSDKLRFTDCLYSRSLVAKYGWIQREISFPGVTGRADLVNKAQKHLLALEEEGELTLTAADLAKAASGIEFFRTGDMAVVDSSPHGMNDSKFLITEVKLDLSDPTNNTVTFGKSTGTITSQISGGDTYTSFIGGNGSDILVQNDVYAISDEEIDEIIGSMLDDVLAITVQEIEYIASGESEYSTGLDERYSITLAEIEDIQNGGGPYEDIDETFSLTENEIETVFTN